MGNQVATISSQQQHLTANELARRLRTPIATLKHWRLHGQGPLFIRAGKRVLYPLGEIEAWEQRQLEIETAKRRDIAIN